MLGTRHHPRDALPLRGAKWRAAGKRPSRARVLKRSRLQANPAELYVPLLGFTPVSAVKHEELPAWSGKLLRSRCRVAMIRIRMFVVTIGIRVNIMGKALAHTSEGNPRGHLLLEHLRDVARRSRELASMANPSDRDFAAMAEWTGLLHDLGKYRDEFQAYLLGKRQGGIDTQHAVFGAARSLQLRLPWAVAISILGHHAGLSSVSKAREQICNPQREALRISEAIAKTLEEESRDESARLESDPPSEFLKTRRGALEATFEQEIYIRILFSCLVDADYLDTERYMSGVERTPFPLDAGCLYKRLEDHVRKFGEADTPLNQARRDLFSACRDAGTLPRGCFRLNAPTGSGKTLAMLAFALKHAEQNQLRRVIIVLPFLAIIEQNARIYREALRSNEGDEVVVEHHSAVKVKVSEIDSTGESDENESRFRTRSKQATENWDAPVIVTTAVQFLESLFSRRPGSCRKLHNIAQSVVVFDEVQTLPFPLLEPILSAVSGLRDRFGVSFLFGSATQPRFERGPSLPSGFSTASGECHEIGGEQTRVPDVFRRASLSLPCLANPAWSWDHLVDHVRDKPQSLIIVNLRKHAQELFDKLKLAGVPNLFHLSSTMCAAHRETKLGSKDTPAPVTIHHALKTGAPSTVVATQVVEAGVDIDFPVVFRALGPLDAIIQAAGRCDREGKLTSKKGSPGGEVIVFELEGENNTPPGFYSRATILTKLFLEKYANDPQRLLDDPHLFAEYHAALIGLGETREKGFKIQDARKMLDFIAVDELFRVIDEAGQGVVIPYDEAATRLLEEIRGRQHLTMEDRRVLQRYTVNLYPTWVSAFQSQLRPVFDREGAPLQFIGVHDPDLGLRLGELPIERFLC